MGGSGIDARVSEAMAAVPRAGFLPEREREHAAYDGPIAIGHGMTSSQPTTVARMLTLLDVREGHRVLDVGSGSGWTTALLAHLAGPSGVVLGVERVPDLVASGALNLARSGMPWAGIEPAVTGVLGSPSHAPWDRILVSAMATRLPATLVDQLAEGGVLVCPVAGRMLRAVRRATDVETDVSGYYRFVPLIE